MAFNKLDFQTSNLLDPTRGARQALGSVGGLLSEYQAEQTAKEARQDKLLTSAAERAFREKQLAQQKDLAEKRMAATASARSAAKSDRDKALLAQAAGNEALMKAMLPTSAMQDVVTEKDAASSIMADKEILAGLEAESTLTPFMQGAQAPMEAVTSGMLADVIGGAPVDQAKLAEYMRDTGGQSDLSLFPDAAPSPLPSYGGQPRAAMFQPPVQEVAPEAPILAQPTPIVSTGEEQAAKESLATILSEGAKSEYAKEAGLVTQQAVETAATTDSMVNSLMQSYQEADTPRAKNAIAKKIVTLKNTQAATAAENKKYTAKLNEIEYKERMKSEYSAKTNSTLTRTMSPENIQKFISKLPGLSDGGFFASLGNYVVGNNKGLMTPAKLASYAMAANKEGLTEAQIKSAMTTLSSNNWFFDNDVTETAGEFVIRAKKLAEGKEVLKR